MNPFEARSLSSLRSACVWWVGLALCGAMCVSGQEAGDQKHDHASHDHAAHGHASHDHAGHGHKGTLNSKGFHHDFSDAERWAKRFDSPDRPDWQKPESVMTLMGVEPGMTVADLGAGTGFFLGYLSKAVGAEGRVLALDVEQTLISHMTDRAQEAGWTNVETRHIPYDSPGLEPASVDRILIVNTWHHIDDRADYSAELLKALRPGGAVYVVDYTLESEDGPPKAHRLAPERVIAEMEGGGLEARMLEAELPRQYVIVGRAGG